MATGSFHRQRIKDNCLRYALTVVRWVVEPSAIVEEKQRRRLRLLAAFLLLIAINTLIGAMAGLNIESLWLSMMATGVILMGAYVLSRTRYYRLAMILAVSIPAFPILAMVFLSPNKANIPIELPWLALPLLVSSLLLPLRSTVIVAVSYIAFIVLLIPFSNVPPVNLSQSLAFMFIMFFFVVAITAARQQDQSEIENELTERRQAEEKLRESEEKYRAIFEQSMNSIVLIDTETAEIVDFNDKAHQNLGYSREEFAKLKVIDFDVIDSLEDAKRRNDNSLKERPNIFETKHRTKDDEIRDVLVSNKALNIKGTVFSLGVWLDITESKRMEEALRESEEKYRAIFEQSTDSIVLIDTETEAFVDFNDRAHQNLGYTREEFAKLTITDIDATQSHEETLKHLEKTYGGGTDVFETKQRTKDGNIRDVLVSIKMLNISGKIFSLAIWHDITARRQAEEKIKQALSDLKHSSTQLAATNKELEAFSYSVSHDLRSPLRTIDGFSQALLEDYPDKLDDQGRDYLQRVRSASQRMGTLIDNLLKLSRLSRSEMHQEPVDLSTLVEEIAAELQQAQPERHVKFAINPGLTATGDRQLLRVALENLLGNAWKFTGKRQQAKIEFGDTQNGDKKAYFVRDNGAGFDMTYANKLFGAFQRLHETTEFPGTGIGLATVQRIIHRHGGRVWAEGVVGEGATFYFTLS